MRIKLFYAKWDGAWQVLSTQHFRFYDIYFSHYQMTFERHQQISKQLYHIGNTKIFIPFKVQLESPELNSVKNGATTHIKKCGRTIS